MQKIKNYKYLLTAVILLVFVINIFQSSSTELLPDEAYYWVYSQYMDWGYFDHPPLVAVWIKISSFISETELGVRFFSAISFSLMAFVVWKTIIHQEKKKYKWLVILIFFSTALLNAYGFITTPDTPLMLFIAIFLYAYQKYITEKNTFSYVLLSIAIAGLLYSKYQGFLIVLFVLLSNLKALKDGKIWLMTLGVLLLFSPHLIWQYQNDFPSFKYHLIERASNRNYKFEHTLMHFVNMIAILGVTFPIMYKAFFKNLKSKNLFFKGLNFIIFGFLIFFFFSSFRGRVQAQWIAPISIPLIIITFHYLAQNVVSRKWFIRLAFINISIMFMARVLMFSEGILPVKLNTHGNKAWATELKDKTQGYKKFFINSYQNVATYWYYTKEKAFYYKNFTGRKNHFNLLQENHNLSTKNVAMVSRIRLQETDFATQIRGKDSIFTTLIKNYNDVHQLDFEFSKSDITITRNAKNSFSVTIFNNSEHTINLDNLEFFVCFQKEKKKEKFDFKAELLTDVKNLRKKETLSATLKFTMSDQWDAKIYTTLGIGIKSNTKIDVIRVSKLINYKIIK